MTKKRHLCTNKPIRIGFKACVFNSTANYKWQSSCVQCGRIMRPSLKTFDIIKKSREVGIPDETVISKIFIVRGRKIMLDKDLAELYDVETKALNQAVKRN